MIKTMYEIELEERDDGLWYVRLVDDEWSLVGWGKNPTVAVAKLFALYAEKLEDSS